MAVVDRLDDLAPQEFCFKLRHLPVRLHLEVSVETATVDVFHDEEDLLVALKDFIQFCDVLMVEFFHDFHLSFHRFPPIRLHQLCLLVDLNCDLLV